MGFHLLISDIVTLRVNFKKEAIYRRMRAAAPSFHPDAPIILS